MSQLPAPECDLTWESQLFPTCRRYIHASKTGHSTGGLHDLQTVSHRACCQHILFLSFPVGSRLSDFSCSICSMDNEASLDGLLSAEELFWRDHYEWLQRSGYRLRPRYAPDWVPSWKGTTKFYRSCEDGISPSVSLVLVCS